MRTDRRSIHALQGVANSEADPMVWSFAILVSVPLQRVVAFTARARASQPCFAQCSYVYVKSGRFKVGDGKLPGGAIIDVRCHSHGTDVL